MEKFTLNIRPKCDFTICYYGIRLIGMRLCHGMFWSKNCPEFIEHEEFYSKYRNYYYLLEK